MWHQGDHLSINVFPGCSNVSRMLIRHHIPNFWWNLLVLDTNITGNLYVSLPYFKNSWLWKCHFSLPAHKNSGQLAALGYSIEAFMLSIVILVILVKRLKVFNLDRFNVYVYISRNIPDLMTIWSLVNTCMNTYSRTQNLFAYIYILLNTTLRTIWSSWCNSESHWYD